MFGPIEELEQLAIAGKHLYSQTQLVDIGLKIISNTNDFENALIECYGLPNTNQARLAFKTHFTAKRKNLRKVRGKNTRSEGFHQASLVVSTMDNIRNEVLQKVRTVQDTLIAAVN